MSHYIEVSKSEGELPIPTIWRKVFYDIVESFKADNFTLDHDMNDVDSISDDEAKYNKNNILAYGESLGSLDGNTWETSICRWMGDHWDVLVDLNTLDGESDLVLFATVRDENGKFRYKVNSVHVP